MLSWVIDGSLKFPLNLQVAEFKLCLAVSVFEKCLKGNTKERACYCLMASPFLTDLLHCGITPMPFIKNRNPRVCLIVDQFKDIIGNLLLRVMVAGIPKIKVA